MRRPGAFTRSLQLISKKKPPGSNHNISIEYLTFTFATKLPLPLPLPLPLSRYYLLAVVLVP